MRKIILGGALALALAAPAMAQPVPVRVTVDTSKAGAEIDRHIYGQFAEHLGHGIYGGIWVGRGQQDPQHPWLSHRCGGGAEGDPCAGGPLAGRLLRRPL